jgi:hypothetical protein
MLCPVAVISGGGVEREEGTRPSARARRASAESRDKSDPREGTPGSGIRVTSHSAGVTDGNRSEEKSSTKTSR